MGAVMQRGEIWQVNFSPTGRGQSDADRPAVVVSNDRANATAARAGHGGITVVPVTGSIATIYPFQVLLPADATGLATDSKAQAEHVRSVDIGRLRCPIGRVSPAELAQLDDALRLHLDL
jgi:mRNA interferase MazF